MNAHGTLLRKTVFFFCWCWSRDAYMRPAPASLGPVTSHHIGPHRGLFCCYSPKTSDTFRPRPSEYSLPVIVCLQASQPCGDRTAVHENLLSRHPARPCLIFNQVTVSHRRRSIAHCSSARKRTAPQNTTPRSFRWATLFASLRK